MQRSFDAASAAALSIRSSRLSGKTILLLFPLARSKILGGMLRGWSPPSIMWVEMLPGGWNPWLLEVLYGHIDMLLAIS